MQDGPAPPAEPQGFVFIVTYGRSGSTLTQNLLNSIPGYCIRGENGNLGYHLARAYHLAASEENFVQRRSSRPAWTVPTLGTPRDPWFGAENVDPEALGTALFDAFRRHVLCLPAGTRVGGFKDIKFHSDARFFFDFLAILERFFPNTRFLFQSRRADRVARSGWWARHDPTKVAEIVRTADGLFRDFMQMRPSSTFLIDYDELYVEQSADMKDLFDFLGEHYDERRVANVLSQRLDHMRAPPPARD